MIPALRTTSVVVAFLLLGAHFFRSGSLVLAGASALAPLLLFVKKTGIRYFLKALLFLGAIVWVQTAFILVQQRLAAGAPWIRLLVILGCVVLFTFHAGWLIGAPPAQGNDPPAEAGEEPPRAID